MVKGNSLHSENNEHFTTAALIDKNAISMNRESFSKDAHGSSQNDIPENENKEGDNYSRKQLPFLLLFII